jgi:hypothetical protein
MVAISFASVRFSFVSVCFAASEMSFPESQKRRLDAKAGAMGAEIGWVVGTVRNQPVVTNFCD